MRHVFVSYCHDDADFAQIVKEELRRSGYPVWADLDLRAGDAWHAEIETAIKNALAVALVLSECARVSAFVNFEWAFALGAGVPVLPLVLKSPAQQGWHPRLAALQMLDFSNYMLRPWDRLREALKAIAQIERPFTILVPRDAPPFIQQSARSLDSINPSERIQAVTGLAELDEPSAREVLVEALRHPAGDVREIAAKALAESQDLRAIPAVLEAIRFKRFDYVNYSTLVQFGEGAIPVLTAMLREKSQSGAVRLAIAFALGKLRSEESLEALHESLSDADPELRAQVVESLAGEPRALPWILEAARESEPRVRWTALKGLRQYRGPEVIAVLCEALRDPGLSVRQAAAESLEDVADASAVPALVAALRDEDNVVTHGALKALSKAADASVIPALIEQLSGNGLRWWIADLLAQFKDAALQPMLGLLRSEDKDLRAVAASVLGKIGDRSVLSTLIVTLNDGKQEVRKEAAFALGKLKDPRAVQDLIALSMREDEFDDVRRAAALALDEIGTRDARAAYKAWKKQADES